MNLGVSGKRKPELRLAFPPSGAPVVAAIKFKNQSDIRTWGTMQPRAVPVATRRTWGSHMWGNLASEIGRVTKWLLKRSGT